MREMDAKICEACSSQSHEGPIGQQNPTKGCKKRATARGCEKLALGNQVILQATQALPPEHFSSHAKDVL